MATLKTFSLVPPKGWIYIQPETEQHFAGFTSFDELLASVQAHRTYKGLDPSTAALDIQRQICAALGPEYCKDEPGETHIPVQDKTMAMTVDMALSFNKALVPLITRDFCPPEEADARAKICRGCTFNVPAKTCSCGPAYSIVESLIPADRKQPLISVCMACGCSLQAKVNLPIEVIRRANSGPVTFPPWCWQRQPLNGTDKPDTTS